jgi:hypothetical protein
LDSRSGLSVRGIQLVNSAKTFTTEAQRHRGNHSILRFWTAMAKSRIKELPLCLCSSVVKVLL